MGTKSNQFIPKLKFYHIILISIILCTFLMLNSNSVNKKREEAKLEKEKIMDLRKLYARKLDSIGDEKLKEDSNKVCEKASKELRDYYSGKGDLKSLGIDKNKNVKREDQGEYIDGLINTISGEGEGSIMDYIMHIIPILALLVIGVLFLPGWLVCCICTCADCCCCCCCKKSGCKLPFYIITSVFYVFGLAISFYGLSQTTNVFEGLGDTECSLLKFISEVLDGESELKEPPRWGGINKIQDLLSRSSDSLSSLRSSTTNQLRDNKDEVETSKNNFENALKTYSQKIKNDVSTEEGNYKKVLTISSESGTYVLDIVNDFGVFDSANPSQVTPNSFVQRWYLEYSVIAENSQTQMQTVYENYDGLQRGQAEAQSALNDGISSLNEIKDSFDKVKKKISSVIVKYSDKIDEYGNIGYKAIFSIFLVIDALIAAFISLRMFCKFPTCQSGCLNCLLKSGIHILWNILAFTTFLTLILGSLLTLVGTAGNDLISVVSFLVSDENLGKSNENDIILLGSAAKYLKKCINGNGDLRHELNLDNGAAKNLDDLKEASNKIEELEEETQALQQKIEYTKYLENYNKRKMYQTDDFSLVNIDDNKLNSENYNEEWRISCSNNEHSCDSVDSSHSSPYCIKLSSCSSKKVSNWYTTSTDNIKVVDAFIESINTAKFSVSPPTTSTNTKSIENVLKILDDQYSSFLRTQVSSLVSIVYSMI